MNYQELLNSAEEYLGGPLPEEGQSVGYEVEANYEDLATVSQCWLEATNIKGLYDLEVSVDFWHVEDEEDQRRDIRGVLDTDVNIELGLTFTRTGPDSFKSELTNESGKKLGFPIEIATTKDGYTPIRIVAKAKGLPLERDGETPFEDFIIEFIHGDLLEFCEDVKPPSSEPDYDDYRYEPEYYTPKTNWHM